MAVLKRASVIKKKKDKKKKEYFEITTRPVCFQLSNKWAGCNFCNFKEECWNRTQAKLDI